MEQTKRMNEMEQTAESMKELHENIENHEELKNDPSYKIFDHIYQTSTRLFDDDETKKTYAVIAGAVGTDAALSLMSFMVVAMTQSAYEAVAFYHNMMMDTLGEQFTSIIDHVNGNNADIEGITAAVSTIRERLDKLQNEFESIHNH